MALYEERVKELELGPMRRQSSSTIDDEDAGGELNDAMSGRTMTDLKLQVRPRQRFVLSSVETPHSFDALLASSKRRKRTSRTHRESSCLRICLKTPTA